MLLFVLLVVLTPLGNWWLFITYLLIIFTVILIAKLPPLTVIRRMVIEVPFVIFAVLMPFFSAGPYVSVLGMQLSEAGLTAGIGLLFKGTIGVLSSITLASTTPMREVLSGLSRLKVPNMLVEIAAFMVRYVDVVVDEMRRMRIARQSRGYFETGIRSWPVIAKAAGALFIRAYERGERVHLAMLSRGYQGKMPSYQIAIATNQQWLVGMILPISAVVVLILGWRIS
ncbi:MAG: cobalt ECF transporter T component CbiQ [Actinobacteria bacterium]|nr:cobalt ECF transporter T component CbiQ [Actinomycetota bacterium]